MLLENLVLGALFFLLVPGVLVSLPQGGSKFTVALVHAVVFVLAYMVLQNLADYGGYDYAVYEDEGFKGGGRRPKECINARGCYMRKGLWGSHFVKLCYCDNTSGATLCGSTEGKCYI